MERPVKGDIVVISFPFSDFTAGKRRPALVIASPKGNDSILCQITSKNIKDSVAIPIAQTDFSHGSLRTESNIRPDKIFTANKLLRDSAYGSLFLFVPEHLIGRFVF